MKKENTKFIITVILAVGFLFLGYLYALNNRYEMYQKSRTILDKWTGKVYFIDIYNNCKEIGDIKNERKK